MPPWAVRKPLLPWLCPGPVSGPLAWGPACRVGSITQLRMCIPTKSSDSTATEVGAQFNKLVLLVQHVFSCGKLEDVSQTAD